MRPRCSSHTLIAALTIASASAVLAQTDREFSFELSSEQVGPTTADPDGSGTAQVTASLAETRFCYELTVQDIAPPFAAHLHQAALGQEGPVLLALEPPADGSSSGCVTADRDLLAAIIGNPSAYYIDVHNSEYPGAALRGQLATEL